MNNSLQIKRIMSEQKDFEKNPHPDYSANPLQVFLKL